ncbi:MAG TPA: LLM class flavin-dependent oxidoreductase [Candidatus Binatia bacterium]|jgi:alkanesulfonate monooxygenase SsuD/methylene tetrahydromethanopterin reductase-like flavin-dependent oxidoreductase (luciferase family)
MKLGLYPRNMGPQSTRQSLLECVRAAEDSGIDDVWVADHVAIPPDDAEGSDGRYLDPLATLAFLAGATTRAFAEAGVTRLVHGWRYESPSAFRHAAEVLGGTVRSATGS